jgi:NAD/NADP transhydrogenase alpha subunit
LAATGAEALRRTGERSETCCSSGRNEGIGRARSRRCKRACLGDIYRPLYSSPVRLLFWFIGAYAPAAFLGHFTVFVLACFVGYMVVWNVTPSLHTPLMSVTNAISSIIAIGALVQIAPPVAAGVARPDEWIRWLALIGIALTTVNMFGGFAVTQRMLAMFRK